jgi:hypothetical protein
MFLQFPIEPLVSWYGISYIVPSKNIVMWHTVPIEHKVSRYKTKSQLVQYLIVSYKAHSQVKHDHYRTYSRLQRESVVSCKAHKAGSLKMNTALEYSTRVVQEGGRRCKKSTLNDLVHLTPLRIPLMNPPIVNCYRF